MTPVLLGAVEVGGTKVICLVGSGPDHVVARTRIPTTDPAATIARVVGFFRGQAESGAPVRAVGIAAFGPLELRPDHPGYGRVRATPKPRWSDVDLVGPVREGLGVPVGFDTDVNGAALGEGRWGAARGLDTFGYVTVGTGVGVGVVAAGRVLHGLGHPEMGHLSVPRQDGDEFPGCCPFHGDCLEGMASGAAMAARWGRPAESLEGAELTVATRLEAGYLAAGLRNVVYALAPQRIVIGGSVTALPGLFALLRAELAGTLGGYPGLAEHGRPDFVVPAGLGAMAGPAGAFVLAEAAHHAAG